VILSALCVVLQHHLVPPVVHFVVFVHVVILNVFDVYVHEDSLNVFDAVVQFTFVLSVSVLFTTCTLVLSLSHVFLTQANILLCPILLLFILACRYRQDWRYVNIMLQYLYFCYIMIPT
jgi:hypothetical protein